MTALAGHRRMPAGSPSARGWLGRLWSGHLPPPVLQASLFVFLVCTCVLGLTSWRIQRAYDLQLQMGQATAANLARTLADQAHATVHIAATIVSGAVERLETEGTDAPQRQRMHRVLARFLAETPSLAELSAFAADGSILATALDSRPMGNVADREYFAFHRDHRDIQVRVGGLIRNWSDGRWTFTVSRRFNNPDGSFGGVVVALIDCDTLARFYRSFDIGNGAITIMNEDATLLVRQPAFGSAVGQNYEHSPLMQAYRESGPVGLLQSNSILDGVSRISSFRKVDDYPLVIFASLSRGDLLKPWRADAFVSLVVALAMSAILTVVGLRLASEFNLQTRKDMAIRRSERQYRLLADYSTDIITHLGLDGRRLYVSPACERMLGYHPVELVGGLLQDTTHPEDCPRLAANVAEILSTGRAPPVTYRVRRKDGIYLPVEMQGQKLDDEQGFIVALRDISARRRVEDLLHQANNHLQRQVMLDGLTSIPNRRCFDLTLQKEFRRNARSQTPLGALMLDVDHFKAFNDRYGHQAGDACLQSVAEIISKQLRRPADFAARYGGEEFVVLLPDTDEAGAQAIAHRIRAAVEAEGITHGGSAFGVVTVSIGVGVVRPQSGENAEAGLVSAADAALYRAKINGRNGVHADEPPRLVTV